PVGVLLVEGNTLVLDTLSRWLGHHGFAVWPTADGAAALELLRGGAPIDLALVEMDLPGLDGLATLAALRALRPGLVCCLMGSSPTEAEQARRRAAGAACVLDKPVMLRDLGDRLRGLLLGGESPSAPVRGLPAGA